MVLGIGKAAAKAAVKETARVARKAAVKAKVERPGQKEFLEPKTAKDLTPERVEPDTAVDNVPPLNQEKFASPEEAARLSGLKFDDFVVDKSFQPNFDTVNTVDDVKAIIADLAERNAPKIDEARRGTITEQQLRGLANDLDIKEDVVLAVIKRDIGSLDNINAETIVASRQLLAASAQRIKVLSDEISSGRGTDMGRIRLRRQLQLHTDFMNQFFTGFMGARAEAGRLLNAFGMPVEGAGFDVRHMQELVDAANGRDLDKIANAIAMIEEGNVTAVSKLSRQYNQSKVMGVINELFINSILSGPKTHVINTTGNIMMQAMNTAETAVAARIGRFLNSKERVQIGEATALMHGMIGAYRDAFRLAAKSMRTGIALDDVVKFESVRRRSISAEHLLTPEQRATPLGAFTEGLLDGVRIPDRVPFIGGRKVPGIGQITRAPTERVMMPVDEFFKTIAYRSELERRAFLHANDQVSSGAIKASETADVVREFLENTPLKAQQAAEDFTRYVTFQNPLGPVGQAFQTALRKAPVTSLLAPFVRTPVNIFTAGILDRSPLALFRSKFWQAMRTGGRERDMMLARVGMGSATSAVIASYVMDGTITGAGPSDPDAKLLLELKGILPYSIRVGDTYHSFARMEPFAFVIGATADAVEILSHIESDVGGLDDERIRANNAVSAIITGIANNTMSKTYVKGIADFTEMLSDPERFFLSWSKTMTSSLVPFSALRSQLGAIDDPYLREAWTILDNIRVKSGIPGYSEGAPPRRDFFGEPRLRFSGSLLGSMSPIPDRSVVVDDPVLDELITLMEKTRTVPVSMPSKRIQGMRLNVDEYNQFILIARTRPGPNGLTFKETLREMMFSNPEYASATPTMRIEILKNLQHRFDSMAAGRVKPDGTIVVGLLEQENQLFATRMANFRRKRNKLRFGREE